MPKLILGFVGQAGSGKGTAANILKEKYGAAVFTFSDILSDILKRLFLETSRENLINLSQVLRQGFGQDILANAMERQVASTEADIVVVDGIRRPEDIADLRQNPAFHLVEMMAEPELRFERLKKRNQKPGETEMTWEDFLALGQKETEVTISKVSETAELKIDNDGEIPELEHQITELIKKLNS